ncbi:MAG: hypothetical protein IJ419_08510 [Agathobacter sp.]|nr:hypothetical protein [Agathobacter sp.]
MHISNEKRNTYCYIYITSDGKHKKRNRSAEYSVESQTHKLINIICFNP